MEYQQHFIDGKPKQVFKKRGQEYTRKGYDVRVLIADKFKKKCSFLGETESRVVERLVECFTLSTGWGESVKSAPLDPNVANHIKESAQVVHKDLFPWFSQN